MHMTVAIASDPLQFNRPRIPVRTEPMLSWIKPNNAEALPMFFVTDSNARDAPLGLEIPEQTKIKNINTITADIERELDSEARKNKALKIV